MLLHEWCCPRSKSLQNINKNCKYSKYCKFYPSSWIILSFFLYNKNDIFFDRSISHVLHGRKNNYNPFNVIPHRNVETSISTSPLARFNFLPFLPLYSYNFDHFSNKQTSITVYTPILLRLCTMVLSDQSTNSIVLFFLFYFKRRDHPLYSNYYPYYSTVNNAIAPRT